MICSARIDLVVVFISASIAPSALYLFDVFILDMIGLFLLLPCDRKGFDERISRLKGLFTKVNSG